MSELPDKKYEIIYADPPWSYRVYAGEDGRGTAASHYSTMSMEDLFEFPIKKICEDSCVLFMWATFPCLQEALDLIVKWGFTYKTAAFVWCKRNKKSGGGGKKFFGLSHNWFWGLGNYTRANAEICLLATRGESLPRISKSIHQIVDDRITSHSQKPNSIRKRIVELFGDRTRIELFAREKMDGWDCWGNECCLK